MHHALFDIDGTIDRNPQVFRRIMRFYGWDRYLITARPETERLITENHLLEWGIQQRTHYEELIMWPEPYLFYRNEKGDPIFISDNTGIAQYRDMDHRRLTMQSLVERGLYEQYDSGMMQQRMAEWKVQKCKELNIKVAFEDNPLNIKFLREAGVYVFAVDCNFC